MVHLEHNHCTMSTKSRFVGGGGEKERNSILKSQPEFLKVPPSCKKERDLQSRPRQYYYRLIANYVDAISKLPYSLERNAQCAVVTLTTFLNNYYRKYLNTDSTDMQMHSCLKTFHDIYFNYQLFHFISRVPTF